MIQLTPTTDDTLRLINGPIVDWSSMVWGFRGDAARAMAKDAASIAERAAMLAAYLDARTSNVSHDKAVKRANTVRAKLRKAMGFSYPRAGEVSW